MKLKSWIKSLLSGAAIGVASAIPGVSGGTIAVVCKIYDTIIYSVGNLFKNFFKSLLTLLPILLGVVLAFIPCMFLFDLAFEGFVFGVVSLFAGLIIGSFPGIIDEVKGQPLKKRHIVTIIITILLTLGLGFASVFLSDKIDISGQMMKPDWWFYIVCVLVGVVGATALVVPGISGSMLLLVLGFYKPTFELATNLIKNTFSGNFDGFLQGFLILLAIGAGIIIGVFTISKLMSFLLNKYRLITFYAIIGFIIGSTITLYFNHEIYTYYQVWAIDTYIWMPAYIEIPIATLLLVGGAFGSYQLVKVGRKHKEKEA